ncbi:MAG: AraC family transcriptional regulator [Saprospiraceae bacterium]|nr:AraC family transcriptional regulator [Saprospiraceae bacterium]
MYTTPHHLEPYVKDHRHLQIDGCTLVESCSFQQEIRDTIYLPEHFIIHIRQGQLHVRSEGKEVILGAGETLFARKGSHFHFRKSICPQAKRYESMIFFLQPHFIRQFISEYQSEHLLPGPANERLIKLPASELMEAYVQSVFPYIDLKVSFDAALLRLKTFELLYHLSSEAPELPALLQQILRQHKPDLIATMETHFRRNLSLPEFARLSGRSLAAFKRDFKQTFHLSPGKWLKAKRLELAHTMLKDTGQKPVDIYLEVGFSSYAHFSKSFKAHFGYSPSTIK